MKRRKRGITRLEHQILDLLYRYVYDAPFTLTELANLFHSTYPFHYKDVHVCYITFKRTLDQLYRKGMISIPEKQPYRRYNQFPDLQLTPKAIEFCETNNLGEEMKC